jgi:hypothetical protein
LIKAGATPSAMVAVADNAESVRTGMRFRLNWNAIVPIISAAIRSAFSHICVLL